MLDTLPYKIKNKLLNVGAVILVLAIYQFGIKKSINVYGGYTSAKETAALIANVPGGTVKLEKGLAEIETRIKGYGNSGTIQEQELLGFLSTYCQQNNILLREFPEAQFSEQGGLSIETNRFVVQGKFEAILQLIYFMEQKNKIGKVASVNYQLKKEPKSKMSVLIASIYLQNVKKKPI